MLRVHIAGEFTEQAHGCGRVSLVRLNGLVKGVKHSFLACTSQCKETLNSRIATNPFLNQYYWGESEFSCRDIHLGSQSTDVIGTE